MRKNHKWTVKELKRLIAKPEHLTWREWNDRLGYTGKVKDTAIEQKILRFKKQQAIFNNPIN